MYKGKSKVVDGKFKFEFIVPLDIDYDFGKGKIEYYAQDGTIDAQGAFRSLIIGGSSNNIINDTKGPEIDVYMNDTNFVSGSSTNESPLLIAHFFDEHGINTTGNGIGHEITATLKHDMNNVIILNNHFESDIGSYQRGKLQYQLLNCQMVQIKLLFVPGILLITARRLNSILWLLIPKRQHYLMF